MIVSIHLVSALINRVRYFGVLIFSVVAGAKSVKLLSGSDRIFTDIRHKVTN